MGVPMLWGLAYNGRQVGLHIAGSVALLADDRVLLLEIVVAHLAEQQQLRGGHLGSWTGLRTVRRCGVQQWAYRDKIGIRQRHFCSYRQC
jgi:hypothetical protein